MSPPLVLASTSPQRRAILEQLGSPSRSSPPLRRARPAGAEPDDLVRDARQGKAHSVHLPAVTLGVDTTVDLDGRVYGKPADAEDAERMLVELSGRTHTVVSGLCLLGAGVESSSTTTDVTFRRSRRSVADVSRERRVAGARGRVRDPGARRPARRANRGRLPQRRRASRRALVSCSSATRRSCSHLAERCSMRLAAEGRFIRPEAQLPIRLHRGQGGGPRGNHGFPRDWKRLERA